MNYFLLLKEKKKLKLLKDVSLYENTNTRKLIKVLILLNKYSTNDEQQLINIRIAGNLIKLYQQTKKNNFLSLAIKYYSKSLPSFPSKEQPEILFKVADCYLSLNKISEAVSYLTKSLFIDPNYFTAFNSLLYIDSSEFTIEKRCQFLYELLTKYPSNGNISYYFGLHYKSDLNKSNEYFTKAIEMNCTIKGPYYYLIERALDNDNFSKAYKYLELLNNSFPNSSDVYEELGDFYRKKSEYYSLDEAKNNYLKAVELDPIKFRYFYQN